MTDRSTILARHYLPGGREQGGGIGRLVKYIAETAPPGVTHRVADTRGPRFRLPGSALHLAAAMATLLADRIVAPERIHHIHVAGRGSTVRKVILTAVARAVGARHVLHLHDYDYASDLAHRPPWQVALVRRMFQGADRVAVLGQRDRDTVVHDLGVEPARVVILRNSVPDPGPRQPREAAVPTILFLGTLGPRKGVPELLSALALPVMRDLRWRAVLAGDGPVETYAREARSLGLADPVSMPGWLDSDATRALLSEATILVLPSHGEGMAMAVLEGLAHGLAVVTTRVGAHQEAIEDGVSGVFVPVGDAPALAATLARLVADPATCDRLGSAARERYLTHFSMDGYMVALSALYADLLPDRLVQPARMQGRST